MLVKQRGALDEILNVAPVALNNLALTYNPQAGTLDTRANQGQVLDQIAADPAAFLCGIVDQADTSGSSCSVIEQAFAKRRPGAFGRAARQAPQDRFDQSLGGIVEARLMTRLKMLLLLLASSLVLSGCGGFDVYKLPLPGGPDAGDNPMTIEVKFADVLDLVPRSTVKVNDVSVGQVSDVALEGTHARVTLELRNDVKLPDDTDRRDPPDQPARREVRLAQRARGRAEHRACCAAATSSRCPAPAATRRSRRCSGALSLLLNGGGVAQLKTITQELNKALEGREGSARSVLHEVRTLVTQLDDNKADIVNAIDSLNTLALSVRKQQGSIDAALEELPSALRSIDTQRDDLVRMLKALDRLSGVGVRVIKASKDSTIATFRELQPVLKGFSDSGDNFAKAFSVFLTYPFVDEVVGRDPQVARNLHMGDYTNLSITLDVVDRRPVPAASCPTCASPSTSCRTCPPCRSRPTPRRSSATTPRRCCRTAWRTRRCRSARRSWT